MILLQTEKIARYFGAEKLFDDVSIEIKDNARIGLVGRNGAGKTTILEILSGQEEADAGNIYKKKELTIGYLDQHTGLDSSLTIWNEMMKIAEPLLNMEKEMRQIENQLSDSTLKNLDPNMKNFLNVTIAFKLLSMKKMDTVLKVKFALCCMALDFMKKIMIHLLKIFLEDKKHDLPSPNFF